MKENITYKCYISNINNVFYYWYIYNNKVFCNSKADTKKAEKIKDLISVKNTEIIELTDLMVHIKLNISINIYGNRDTFYDLGK